MKKGSKVGIVCCSNGQKTSYRDKIELLVSTLSDMGLVPVFSDYIYEKEYVFSGTAKEKAKALMDFYKDDEIKAIFDISGGDIANGILPYLDYEVIAENEKQFWGYSDLTTVVNAIYTKTGKTSVLYQIRNLIYADKESQIANFSNTVFEEGKELFEFKYEFVQGEKMQGIVIGGNIRCFLKLAGTEYMSDLTGKILLLESLSGTVAKMETYLAQLSQLGVFDKVAGVLLGTFTEMEELGCKPDIVTLLQQYVKEDMPIAVTKEIGHGVNSKAIVIGQEISL
ncbi:MAG: LD-carboxypeptidase [Lachnospiraceae bacterium]|nr:LD-carboxypeptidase [Lachnospiraceae bacterium]